MTDKTICYRISFLHFLTKLFCCCYRRVRYVIQNYFIYYLPGVLSSGDKRTLRSGSSPYQKIQSSLDVERLRGGGGGDGPGSNISAVRGVETRRHTHSISAARQRA